MDESFRTFLQSSKNVKHEPKKTFTVKPVVENKVVISSDPRVGILKEKVEYFCKKYGDIGADALDDFFKESVEKFSGFKSSIKSVGISERTVVESAKPMNDIERANAILIGEIKGVPATQQSNKQKMNPNDIMARAASIMG
jgi:hypothetical protein